jgi:hypothetical protein
MRLGEKCVTAWPVEREARRELLEDVDDDTCSDDGGRAAPDAIRAAVATAMLTWYWRVVVEAVRSPGPSRLLR